MVEALVMLLFPSLAMSGVGRNSRLGPNASSWTEMIRQTHKEGGTTTLKKKTSLTTLQGAGVQETHHLFHQLNMVES